MNSRPLDPQSSALTKLRHSPELQRCIVVVTNETYARPVPQRRMDTRKIAIQAVVLLLVLLLVLSVFAAAL